MQGRGVEFSSAAEAFVEPKKVLAHRVVDGEFAGLVDFEDPVCEYSDLGFFEQAGYPVAIISQNIVFPQIGLVRVDCITKKFGLSTMMCVDADHKIFGWIATGTQRDSDIVGEFYGADITSFSNIYGWGLRRIIPVAQIDERIEAIIKKNAAQASRLRAQYMFSIDGDKYFELARYLFDTWVRPTKGSVKQTQRECIAGVMKYWWGVDLPQVHAATKYYTRKRWFERVWNQVG